MIIFDWLKALFSVILAFLFVIICGTGILLFYLIAGIIVNIHWFALAGIICYFIYMYGCCH